MRSLLKLVLSSPPVHFTVGGLHFTGPTYVQIWDSPNRSLKPGSVPGMPPPCGATASRSPTPTETKLRKLGTLLFEYAEEIEVEALSTGKDFCGILNEYAEEAKAAVMNSPFDDTLIANPRNTSSAKHRHFFDCSNSANFGSKDAYQPFPPQRKARQQQG